MISISSRERPFVSGIALSIQQMVNQAAQTRGGKGTYKEKVAMAPMLSVANIRKTLYPMLLMMVSVTLDTTKSKGTCQMML